jgi:hypothetical protein
MNRSLILTNSILWAAVILASAILDAPVFLTLVLLPVAAMMSLLSMRLQDPKCIPVRVRAKRDR